MASSGAGRFLPGISTTVDQNSQTAGGWRPPPGTETMQRGETRSLVTLGRHLRVARRAGTAAMRGTSDWPSGCPSSPDWMFGTVTPAESFCKTEVRLLPGKRGKDRIVKIDHEAAARDRRPRPAD